MKMHKRKINTGISGSENIYLRCVWSIPNYFDINVTYRDLIITTAVYISIFF